MRKIQKGQTLIESLVALAVIITILSAIIIVITVSLYNSQFVRDQNIANKYSQETMEFIRGEQASNISKFSGYSGSGYCINGTNIVNTAVCGGANIGNMHQEIEFRKIDAENKCDAAASTASGAELTRVIVTTSWNSSKCGSDPANRFCHSSKVESCLPYKTGVTP